MLSGKRLCLRYVTQTTSKAESSGDAELEVTFSIESPCKVTFPLNGSKEKGKKESVCVELPCHPMLEAPKHVGIRQYQTSSDGWGIEKLEIQKYPGSSIYLTYSIDGERPQFWIDRDASASYNDLSTCTDGKWCALKISGVPGN